MKYSIRILLAGLLLAGQSHALEPIYFSSVDQIADMRDAIDHNRPGHPRSLKAAGLSEKTFEATDAEINAYLAARVAGSEVRELRSAAVRFKEGKIFEVEAAFSLVPGTLDKLGQKERGFLQRSLEKLLKSENRVLVEGFFTSAKGKGFFQPRRIEVNGFALPQSWVNEILELVGPRIKPPVDFHRLFDLSRGVEKAEILPGLIRVRLRAV
ncbi:MAG: hypothetical protein HY922_01715 [Elusimicrobia bacterium]|nr:hypothetical protein [Elusimicrobiota bacterium]